MRAALNQRHPVTWEELPKHCKVVVLVLGHDCHSGNSV